MELEQRVKLLEQEVKLLKSEVQATLLDIQEQLLSTRFPALRADVAPQPPSPANLPEALSVFRDPPASDRSPVRAAPVKVVKAQASDDEPDPYEELTPAPLPRAAAGYATRSVKANPAADAEARPGKPAPNGKPAANGKAASKGKPGPHAHSPAEAEVAAPPASATDWDTLSRQTEWTIQTVKKIGPERTRQLIDVYAQTGLLSSEVTTVMKRLTGVLHTEAAPAPAPEPAPEPIAAFAEPPPPAEIPEGHKKDQQRNIILRMINYLQNVGKGQEA